MGCCQSSKYVADPADVQREADEQEAKEQAEREAEIEEKVAAAREEKRAAKEAVMNTFDSFASYEPCVAPRMATPSASPSATLEALEQALLVTTAGQSDCPWFFAIVQDEGLKLRVRSAFESGKACPPQPHLTDARIVLALCWRGASGEEALKRDTMPGKLQTAINRAKLSTMPLAAEGTSRAIGEILEDDRASDVRVLMPLFPTEDILSRGGADADRAPPLAEIAKVF